jgi:hypothetical protein
MIWLIHQYLPLDYTNGSDDRGGMTRKDHVLTWNILRDDVSSASSLNNLIKIWTHKIMNYVLNDFANIFVGHVIPLPHARNVRHAASVIIIGTRKAHVPLSSGHVVPVRSQWLWRICSWYIDTTWKMCSLEGGAALVPGCGCRVFRLPASCMSCGAFV